jgi:hypothetical protein
VKAARNYQLPSLRDKLVTPNAIFCRAPVLTEVHT